MTLIDSFHRSSFVFRNQSARTTIYTSIYVCLLAIELLFLLGIEQTETSIFCGFITVFLHCAILSGAAWFCYEGKISQLPPIIPVLTPNHHNSLPFVLHSHLGRAPGGGGPDPQGQLVLPAVLRPLCVGSGYLCCHQSQHLHPERLLCPHGGEYPVLCHIRGTGSHFLCGKC